LDTIIFIHGAWVTPYCWRYFMPWFAEQGYRLLAPAWPLKDRAICVQEEQPDPPLAKIGIPEILAHYKRIIRSQGQPPILIGHSFGGLIVQLLLDQGYGGGGIAICSVPPRGVWALDATSWKSLQLLWTVFGAPTRWPGILAPPEQETDEVAMLRAQGIELRLVPESRRIFRQLLRRAAAVDFRNPTRAPLLLVGCGADRAIPIDVQRRNWERYRKSRAVTDFALFPSLTHMAIAESGHEALAAHCLAWIEDRWGARINPRPTPRPAQTRAAHSN